MLVPASCVRNQFKQLGSWVFPGALPAAASRRSFHEAVHLFHLLETAIFVFLARCAEAQIVSANLARICDRLPALCRSALLAIEKGLFPSQTAEDAAFIVCMPACLVLRRFTHGADYYPRLAGDCRPAIRTQFRGRTAMFPNRRVHVSLNGDNHLIQSPNAGVHRPQPRRAKARCLRPTPRHKT